MLNNKIIVAHQKINQNSCKCVWGLTYFSEFGLAQGRGAGVVGPIVGLHAHVVPARGQAVVVVHLHLMEGGRTEHGV